MARYTKDFPIVRDPQDSFNAVYQNLVSQGFEYCEYDNENVFKKGKGFFLPPTFIKITYMGNFVRLEAWIKYALFPGIYIGEFGMSGYVGFAAKGTMKRAVSQVEMLLQHNPDFANNPNFYKQSYSNNNPSFETHSLCCTNCGIALPQGARFCSKCGKSLL